MKVLFCIDHLRSDGTQRVLCQLTMGLTRRRHRVTTLCLNDSFDAPMLDSLRAAGADVKIAGKAGLAGGYGIVDIVHWMQRERFDAAVTMLFWSDVIGRITARLAHIPRLISSIRARNRQYALWQLLLVRATMPLADAVVLNSRRVAAFAVAGEGVPPDRLIHIPNGVDVSSYERALPRTALCARFGVPEDAMIIGSIGRLTYQKGFDVLLDALAQLTHMNVHLIVAGTGEERDRLHKQARRLGIDRRVHLVGYRRDIPQWLGALDVYVQPSRFEGSPNALLEAMAAGCPIVATEVDGNSELIADGIHGWLVQADHVGSLAGALGEALANRPEARRRGVAAYEHARTEFSVERMVERWEQVLMGNCCAPTP
jgi:glycosyltransferase involved in cell wall biosynthesis